MARKAIRPFYDDEYYETPSRQASEMEELDREERQVRRYERLEARVASLERRIAELEAAEVKRQSKK